MPSYLHPGVYLEEIPSGAKPIEGVSTSVAALVGHAYVGPIGEPTLVHSWDEYRAAFGDIDSDRDHLGLAAFNFFLNGGRDAYIARLAQGALNASLPANTIPGRAGGSANAINVLAVTARSAGLWGNALRARVTASDGLRFDLEISRWDGEMDGINEVTSVLEKFTNLSMDTSDPGYVLTVVNGGSRQVTVDVSSQVKAAPATFYQNATSVSGELSTMVWTTVTAGMTLSLNIDNLGIKTITLGAAPGGTYDTGLEVAAEIQARVRALGEAYATFTCAFAANVLTLTSGVDGANSSVLVRPGALATLLKLGKGAGGTELHGTRDVVPSRMAAAAHLTGGDNGDLPGSDDYIALFNKLKKVRDVNIVLLPGQFMAKDGTGNPCIDAAIAHCEAMANRMLLVDPPPNVELDQAAKVSALGLTTSTYAALYYPWVKMANPFYNRDTNPNVLTTLTVAPSPFAAGIWARTDGTRGVWKAPAGVEASVCGVAGLEFTVEDGEQDQLNPEGVNCLRKLPSFGAVLWGTRTLSTKANPEWRYVPVRRTALYIESSIYNGIQWAVFEPNDHRLWSSLRTNVGAFMDGLFRAGAFQGQKASDAYFVRCGLGDTMTQDDIDRGQVIAIVGFAPLKPAEFVIVRIQQKVGQS